MATSGTSFSFPLTLLLIAALYLPLRSGAHKSSALPGCSDACGDVIVSYPFGIGEGCFLRGFEVHCVEKVPFLSQGNFQIHEILPGQVRVNSSDLIANTCESPSDLLKGIPIVSLPDDSPYTFSSRGNRLFVVGCNITGAAMHGIKSTSTCTTVCHGGERIGSGSCKGEGCCATDFFSDSNILGVSAYGADLEKGDFTAGSSCGRAFVAEDGDYTFAESDLWNFSIDSSHLHMRLEWAIGGEEDCNTVRHTVCAGNSSCIESIRKAGYICQCMDGFEGNPYLKGLQGCQGELFIQVEILFSLLFDILPNSLI